MEAGLISKIRGKLTENIFPRDLMPWYTFLALLIKSIIFIGFLIDRTHMHPRFKSALDIVFTKYMFRPVYYCGFILIILSLTFLLKNRVRYFTLIGMNLLLSFLLMIDVWYLRGFDTMPTLHMLQAKSNLAETMSSFGAMIYLVDFIFLVDIPVCIALPFIRRKMYKDVPMNTVFALGLLVVSLFSTVYLSQVANRLTKNIPSNWIFYKFDATGTTYNVSPIGYGIYSSYLYFSENDTIRLDQKKRNQIQAWYAAKRENLPDNQYKGLFKGKNLIIIQWESLENFVLNQKYNGQEITPTMNRLLKNSLYFSDYHEQVGGGNSSDADLMTNASVYPVEMGTTFFRFPFTKYNSMPSMMKNMGYYTSAIHPDNGAFWNWRPALSSMGFNKCYDSSCYRISETINMGISDGVYLSQVEPIIAKQKQPFYTFLVTLSSHTPFDLPKKYRELDLGSDLDRTKIGGYLQCIHYTDKQLGIFFDNLEKDHLMDNTVIAIYGDHEGLHKYFPEAVKDYKPAQDWWMDNKKRIPLVIHDKDLPGEEIKTTGGQIDLLPTISYLMGVDESKYINTAMGRNLLKTAKSFAVLRDREVIGQNLNPGDKSNALQGLEIADTVIRGNYFKKDKLLASK